MHSYRAPRQPCGTHTNVPSVLKTLLESERHTNAGPNQKIMPAIRSALPCSYPHHSPLLSGSPRGRGITSSVHSIHETSWHPRASFPQASCAIQYSLGIKLFSMFGAIFGKSNIELSSRAESKPHKRSRRARRIASRPGPRGLLQRFVRFQNSSSHPDARRTPLTRESRCVLAWLQSETLLPELILFRPVEVSTRRSQSRGRTADIPTCQAATSPRIRWNLT